MSSRRISYPPEYRQQIVELYRAGRKFSELAREFEPSEQTLRTWVKQAEVDAGRRTDGLTTEEREELRRLRRENRTLKLEREILKKAAVDSAGRCNTLYYFTDLEGVVHGTVRTSWPFCDPESGVVATLEKGRVAE